MSSGKSLMKKTAIATLVFLSVFPLAGAMAQTTVRLAEETLVLPTYAVGEPDRNPIFYSGRHYQGAKGAIYPYALMDMLTEERSDKSYRALVLENEYVRIDVLPELGGRIFTGLDKTNNYDFFYRQHVIKPALIGMLGAWISGGVEWNIPHHHRATSFMPVDSTTTENPDGSKTIWIGETEWRHRMRWVIGLTLYPDKSYIEATVKLINRTPFAHSALYWANPAVHANPDYQVLFPPSTEYATYHAKNQFTPWPLSNIFFRGVDYTSGVDLSWWKNHPSPISFFAWNYEDNFHAGYDHGKKGGLVHVADHNVMPGKKLWEWGNGPEGRMWDKILTETDGPYIELMVGGYSDNQPDYSWCQPYEVRILKQYWYPIREIGGVKNANRDAAMNLDVRAGNLARVGIHATAIQRNARVVVRGGEKILFDQAITVGPDRPYIKEITLPAGTREEDLQAALWTSEGKELISYRPAPKRGAPMPEEVKSPPAPKDIKTVEELYLAGLRLEQFYDPEREPYPYYEEALKRDPGNYLVNTALGILFCKRAMFREAEEKLRTAIRRATRDYTSPKDGEAFYYLGVALRAQGEYEEAYAAFFKSTWSLGWQAAGFHALAEISARRGETARALEFIGRSIAMNAWNTKALALKAALLRKAGLFEQAQDAAAQALVIDPLDFLSMNERYLALSARGLRADAEREKGTLEAKMRGSAQSYLEVAVAYGNWGLWDEAINVLLRLRQLGDDTKLFPMAAYYLGYYSGQMGAQDRAAENYRLAAQLPSDYCFPFRFESIDVLRGAMKANPSDARAAYYLGNLLYDQQPQSAVREWEKARGLDASFALTYRNLGFAYAHLENDPAKAVASLEDAIARNPKDPRLFLELDQYSEAAMVAPAERLAMLEKNPETAAKRDDTLARLIVLNIRLGNHDKAIGHLSTHHFHIWEGGAGLHGAWVDAHLLRGQKYFTAKKYQDALKDFEAALEYPENLEVAKPAGQGSPQVLYFIGTALEAMGQGARAEESYKKAAAAKSGRSAEDFYKGQALRKTGREAEALQVFEELIKSANSRLARSSFTQGWDLYEQRNSKRVGEAQAHYLLGLGYLGKNNTAEAKAEFAKALAADVSHVWAAAPSAVPAAVK